MEKKEGRKEFSRNPSLNVNVKRVKLSRRRERERGDPANNRFLCVTVLKPM